MTSMRDLSHQNRRRIIIPYWTLLLDCIIVGGRVDLNTWYPPGSLPKVRDECQTKGKEETGRQQQSHEDCKILEGTYKELYQKHDCVVATVTLIDGKEGDLCS